MNSISTHAALENVNVGDGVTINYYSDRKAATVIKRTPHSITVQRDTATLLNGMDSGEPDALKADIGGFAAHVKGEQRYSYERDTEGAVMVFRRTKRGWTRGSLSLSPGRHEHYDYNF
jgi:hypothetical protein